MENFAPPPSSEVILRAQEGDQDAFVTIFEAFIDPVYRFTLFRSGELHQAEKLTEETFLKIWKNLRRFPLQGRLPFRAYVFKAAAEVTTTLLKNLAKMRPERRQFFLAPGSEPSALTAEQHELARAFAELPDTQAEAVILKYFCQLPNEEIALILEKTEGAVRILQSRGIKRLREVLESNTPDASTSSET